MALPIVPHEWFGADCCGCLIVVARGADADLACNECGALVKTVPSSEVEATLAAYLMARDLCTETCHHCGAVNSFSGFSSMHAFVCRSCGEGVSMSRRVQ